MNSTDKLIRAGDLFKAVCNDTSIRGSAFAAIRRHIDATPAAMQWISVTERLPENDTYILVATDGVAVSAYWHNDRFYAFTANGVAKVGGVTHWMPLPEPPKEA